MRRSRSVARGALFAVLVAAACAAPFALAAPPPAPSDTPRVRIDMSRVTDAQARAGPLPPGARITKTPPDPAPMFERGQWIFDLRYDKGDVYLLGVHRTELPAPQHTPRAMGRFAVELFEGPTMIERVRFDFPLLGAGDAVRGDGGKWTPSFEKRLVSRIGVMFPMTTRGTRLELWDRATDLRWTLPWPPEDTRAASDGGTSASAVADASADAGARRDGG